MAQLCHLNDHFSKFLIFYKILDAGSPRRDTEVRSSSGLVNYCSRFIKDCSTVTTPLRRQIKNNVSFSWGKREQETFESLKSSLTSDELMVAYYNTWAENVFYS